MSEGLAQSEDPRVKRAAPRLERAIQRAVNLAEATLRYGRAEPLAAEPAAGELGCRRSRRLRPKGMAGCGEIEWKLETPWAGDRAMADADHVHRIVANLVRNAARAIKDQPGRTERGRVSARVFRDGDTAVIEIADNGPGVPDAVVTGCSSPSRGQPRAAGAGLGLAIARELARGMKGDLELSSNGASGAAFTLRVPAAA